MGHYDPYVYKLLLFAALMLSAGFGTPANTVDPALFQVELLSSRFVAGEVVHEFGVGESYSLQVGPQCPNGTFTLVQNTGQLIVASTVDFSLEYQQTRCLQTASGPRAVIRTFYCSVVVSLSAGVTAIINVVADLSSTSLTFTRERYAGSVIEGVDNASVSGLADLRPLTLPVDGLTVPQYRLLGSGASSFYVVTQRRGCLAFPLVFTTLALDREQQSNHELLLEAFTTSASANATIVISVLDVNDNSPLFTDFAASADVSERQPLGTALITFSSADSDAGLNALIWHSIATPSAHFSLDPFTGALRVYSPVDDEGPDTSLSLVASDLGLPRLSSLVNISIFITHINELPPVIHVLGAGPLAAVSELSAAGEPVVTVEVRDGDSPDATLELASLDCDGCFALSPLVTGDDTSQFRVLVAADAILDYESFPNGYLVVLTARDNADPPLSSSLQLTLPVADANEPPEFLQSSYTASIAERVPVGTEVLRLQAVDPDTLTPNGDLRYSLSGTDPNQALFTIDNAGVVSTNAAVDYEAVTSVELVVTATDLAEEATSTVVTVTIVDLDDNQPTFSMAEYATSVSEILSPSEPIFGFSVTDVDSGCNGAATYRIVFAEPDVFRLDSFSGLLYAKDDRSLDYEAFQTARVAVEASNLGPGPGTGRAGAVLNITLMNEDDAPPTLDPIQCSCWLREGVIPSSCPQLSAHDPDSSSLTFSIISGNEQGRFSIVSTTGIVFPIAALQYEETSEYSLEVVASDGFRESTPQRLTVIVLDVDDSSPSYTSTISLTVPLDEERGALVGSLAAAHVDAGYNALTNYVFSGGTPTSVTSQFRLDPLSGLLYTSVSPLSVATHSFSVVATALAPSAGQATTGVTVTVQGFKNNPPSFALAVDKLAVPENLDLNDNVFRFEALDLDAGSNGQLLYSLLTGGFPASLFGLSSSGQLTLAQELDGMAGSEFTLEVVATDMGSPSLTAFQQLVITVYPMTITVATEMLIHNPVVGVAYSSGSVLEGTDSIVLVAALPAMELLTPVTYNILDDSLRDMFRIEANEVYTESGFGHAFHRSQWEALHLTLRAQYGTNFHYTSLTVVVADANDLSPQFSQEIYSVDVYRVTPVGAYVFQAEARDDDVGSNAQTEYSIVSSSTAFAIDSERGFIEVKTALTANLYTLVVRAMDKMEPALSSTTNVNISILDSANSQPSFDSHVGTIFTPETAAINSSLLTVSTNDPDPGIHGENSFCISSGNDYGLFRVDGAGQVMVARPLDFESYPSSFQLEIAAFDSSPNLRFSITSLTIDITDVNDEPPIFPAPTYEATVVEGAGEGTPVLTVTATDQDAGLSGEIRYSIAGTEGRFTVDVSTGAITTTSSATNREASAIFSLTLTATDQAPEGSRLSSSVTVTVVILDVNDNTPSFTVGSTTRSISEDVSVGSVVFQLESEDRDEGLNGAVVYAITGSNHNHTFSLDPRTGSVVLGREVDYEFGPRSYILSFGVSDLGSPARSATTELFLTIQVDDVNERAPSFSRAVYNCTVTDVSVGFDPPCLVAATDDDATGNMVQFFVTGGNEGVLFGVDSGSGLLSVEGSLDPASQSSYLLLLEAEDSGVPRKTSTALVLVSILDDSNHIPVFDQASTSIPIDVRMSLGTVSVPETLPRNTLLFFAHASDPGSGVSGYSLSEPSTLFSVDTLTGAVLLTGELDYETSESHSLVVLASSVTGSGTSFSYTIVVLDVSENVYPPEFPPDTPLFVSISRTAAPSTHLTTLTTTDRDGGREEEGVAYYITGGSGYGYFEIDRSQGNISTAYPLAGVEGSELHLVITALDRGSLSSYHELVVSLLGDDKAKPEFVSPMITANAPEGFGGDVVGMVVTVLQALVNDYADGSICYSIASGNENGKFALDASSGVVTVSGGLDREAVPSYALIVQASQTGLEGNSTALLLINVADTNDQRPLFQPVFPDNIIVSVFSSHEVDPDVPVARVFAKDGDAGVNSDLSYTLVPETLPFAISNTGDIYITAPLSAGAIHNITVVVTDDGLSPLSDQTTIRVGVLEVPASANQSPTFLASMVSENIGEDANPGTLVYSASASDADSPTLHYRLVDPPPQFTVLPNSGQIYLTMMLDRDSQPTFDLLVEAFDGTSKAMLRVVVTVDDVNDVRPAFPGDYSFTVLEHTSVTSVVGTVLAIDRDEGINSEVNYFIVDSAPMESHTLFAMSSDGVLSVAGILDRETQPSHVLTIAANDGGSPSLTSYAQVTITVGDIDDHDPSFPFPFPRISVSEGTAVNSTLFTFATFDPDAAANSVTRFSLSPPSAPFFVDTSSGKLSLSSLLNARQQPTHSITVAAFNSDQSSSSAELTFDLTVLPRADLGPQLLVPGPATVPENQPLYTAVSRVTSADPSTPVAYSIVGGNQMGHFIVETFTGIVRTAAVLDREETTSYVLTVRGSYLEGPATNLTLAVSVQDENDNPPSFPSRLRSFVFPEDTSPPLSLGVSDRDSGSNANVQSFIIPDSTAAAFFSVDSAGSLVPVRPLDYENGPTRLAFEVYAVDSGRPPLFSRVYVTVQVEDSNDNSPVFSRSEYSLVLSTPALIGATVSTVSAWDADEGSFGSVQYGIASGNGSAVFDIDSASGEIVVSSSYRLEGDYLLQVSATDGGGRVGVADVYVSARECGFRDLLLEPRFVSLEIPENASVGSDVFQPAVRGFGGAALLDFIFAVSDPHFLLDGSALTVAQTLDRESVPVFRLSIQAQSRSNPERIAQSDVEVIVSDVNDNPPLFQGTPYEWSVGNDIAPGSPVRGVMVTDADIGLNANISFALLSDPSNSFRIDANTGIVTVTRALSAITLGSTVVLDVEARDGGIPPMVATAIVSINIVDSNAPQFSEPIYAASINESAPRGTTVANVTAIGSELTYSITTDEAQLPFNIFAGKVTVNDFGLDYESRQFYQIDLLVTDGANGLTGRARLDVTLFDVNDETPRFSSGGVFLVEIDENVAVGTSILNISASDADSPPNAAISYRLSPEGGGFTIDESGGLITTTGEIDYEVVPQYELTVFAVDSGSPALTGDAVVRVLVTNLNDNRPHFSQTTFFGFLLNETRPGDDVATVIATDADRDALSYAIVGGTGQFGVDSSGIVTLSTEVSRTEFFYILNISVSDGASFMFTKVQIEVEQVNGHSPMFNATLYTGAVAENSPADVYVLQVFATDADQGTNGDVTYSLSVLSFPDNPPFQINPATGVITTTGTPADREQRQVLSVLVFATDGPGRTGASLVEVTLLDENDNAPVFAQMMYINSVLDNADMDTSVLTVRATDVDVGRNGQLVYAIVSTPSTEDASFPFQINADSGVVSTVFEPLLIGTHTFAVTASDRGNVSLSAASPASVEVIIVEDSASVPPAFNQSSYNVTILEGLYFSMEVLTVSATTPACSPSFIIYDIVVPQPTPTSEFLINNHQSGVIEFRGGSLDRERLASYSLVVRATCSVNSIFNFAPITVTIGDVNEPPVLAGFLSSGSISEDASSNSPVMSETPISATDQDTGDNGRIFYRILNLQGAPFYINDDTGVIHTHGNLDRETVFHYQFSVQAFDGGTPSLNSSNTVIVIVTVTDVNDSPPAFNQTGYYLDLAEDTQPGTAIFSAAGVVSDNDTAELTVFMYALRTLEGSSTSFAVNVSTGVVQLANELDRESTPSYELELRVLDGVGSGTTILTVNVTDVNDQPPVFNSSSYTVTLPENYPTHQPILQVFAIDMDEGTNGDVTYSILPTGPLSQEVTVNATTGVVSFLVSPDFDTNQRIELQVQAADIGQLMDFATLAIVLQDLNDNSPVFSTAGGYTAVVSENLRSDTNIDVVDATDLDSGVNGLVTYALYGLAAGNFTVNTRTGVVATNATFDRETTPSFELIVVATDGGSPRLSTNTSLTVTVRDMNDNPPVFPSATYSTSVSEFVSSGFPFLTVGAQDADEGDNAELLYRITGENSDHFSLVENPNGTATLYLARQLNYEAIPSYNLSIRAIDGGIPSLEGMASIVVWVIDENDNPPIFMPPSYSTELEESARVGTTVVTVTATDLDEIDRGRLVYSIHDPAAAPQFSIGNTSGVVTVAAPLDYEVRQSHSFVVMVRDQNATPLSATATVNVDVTDVNDNAPCFTNLANETINITENIAAPHLVRVLATEDRDSAGVNGGPTNIRIQSGNEAGVFGFPAGTSSLSLVLSPDREEQCRYDLVIVASDNGSPALTCTAILTVLIDDENDNIPETGHQDVYVYVLAGEAEMLQGAPLGIVFVNDSDTNDVNSFTFRLDSAAEFFDVRSNGTILVSKPPVPGSYNLSVMVSDPPHVVTSSIRVQWVELSASAVASSFSLQLEGITPEKFVVDSLVDFTSAVTDILISELGAQVNVNVFSVRPAIDSDGRIDVAISVEASDGGPLPPERLQHILHLRRSSLGAGLGLAVHTEHVDPCALHECVLGLACSSPRAFATSRESVGSSLSVLYPGLGREQERRCGRESVGSSLSVLYLGLGREQERRCGPPASLCAALPSCVGASVCEEGAGQAVCHDDCSSDPCRNGGTCFEQDPGYYCHCPSGFDGRNCEQTVGSFSEDSFAVFPGLSQRPNGSVSLEFATDKRDGLLFYTGRYDEDKADFLAVELIDGKATLSVSYGGEEVTTLMVTEQGDLNDRRWHSLIVQYDAAAVSHFLLAIHTQTSIMPACKRAYVYRYMQAPARRTCIRTCIRRQVCKSACVHTHMHASIRIHACMHTRTNVLAYTYMHVQTQYYNYALTHKVYPLWFSHCLLLCRPSS